MHLLFIGYSRIVQRRVLPALPNIPSITHIDIASQTSAAKITLPDGYEGKIFNSYDTALLKSKADLVYVSTINSAHAQWAEKALTRGFHVVVDKPAFTSVRDAEKLVQLSQKLNLCLSEAIVFAYHPQIEMVRNIFASEKSQPTRLTAIFSFPPLNPDDFRYRKEAGGGALWDTGPYAVSIGRIFFQEEPKEVFCRINSWKTDGDLETSYSLLAVYSGGRSVIGHFGFDTEYRNYVNILGAHASVTLERIFTTPADMTNEIHCRLHNKSDVIKAPPGDTFSIFLHNVIDSIKKTDYKEFSSNLLSDALVLNKLRLSAFK